MIFLDVMLSPIFTLYTYFPVQFFVSLTLDLLLMTAGVVLSVVMYKKGSFNKFQLAACIVLSVWGALVLFLTVLGRRMNRGNINSFCNLDLFSCYRRSFFEGDRVLLKSTLQNIAMFIPFGFVLPAILNNKHRFIVTIIISFTLSLFIETCQLLLKSGIFELDDLINNTLGAFLGVILYCVYDKIISKLRKRR